ncbi:hypothetical protein KUCAC02_014889, partial [Chaenocephalus aceratus]
SVLRVRDSGAIWKALCCLAVMDHVEGMSAALAFVIMQRTVIGTPSEETWPGVNSLPHFKPDRFTVYSPKKLRQAWNKLGYVDHGEELASRFLQCFPKEPAVCPGSAEPRGTQQTFLRGSVSCRTYLLSSPYQTSSCRQRAGTAYRCARAGTARGRLPLEASTDLRQHPAD